MARKKIVAEAAVEPTFVYGVRTISADRTSHNGFKWPPFTGEPLRVEAPDWKSSARCGNGMHFCAWGEGDASHYSSAAAAIWQVVRADASLIVDLSGKVKAPWVEIVFEGQRHETVAHLQALPGCAGKRVNYGTATAGDEGTATAGYKGTATAGYKGTATAGYKGTATAGDEGTATAGNYGTATAGNYGTATAGDGGVIAILWWDRAKERYRRFFAGVGEGGIEPGVAYKLDDNGQIMRADGQPMAKAAE